MTDVAGADDAAVRRWRRADDDRYPSFGRLGLIGQNRTITRMQREIPQQHDADLLTPGEVARLFGVGQRAVARWADNGQLPHITTPGGHRRYRVGDVRRLLEQPANTSGA